VIIIKTKVHTCRCSGIFNLSQIWLQEYCWYLLVCMIPKTRDPFRIKFWWVPIKKSQVPVLHYVNTCTGEYQTQMRSPGITQMSCKYLCTCFLYVIVNEEILYTFKPVLRGCLWDKEKVALQDRWPLNRGSIHMKFSMTHRTRQRWPLYTGDHMGMFDSDCNTCYSLRN
jgi:hypothetical protein